jgi:3'(2'),5'-bisphosphate nucleotidase
MTMPDRTFPEELDRLLAGVTAAALRAGAAIRGYEAGCEVWTKDDASPLTQADLAANAIILEALAGLDPATPVISEESPRPDGPAPARFWLVDPLDGTREFLSGNGEYTVNIALVEYGEPVLGVVHAPALDRTYAAARGRGATRTNATGTQPIAARRDGPLVVVASRSHAGAELAPFLAELPPHTTVAAGSSLKLGLVADGTAQLYPRFGTTCWWDIAAGQAVATEAGALVVDFAGAPLRYVGTDVRNPSFACTALPVALITAAAARALPHR